MNVLSKEQIKDRLVKIAAERWNQQESDVDANFDPLVMLLFDAMASELEGLGHLIKDIQGNLLQELSGLMLPQALLKAKPASCIVSALPNENHCTITPETNFTTSTELQKTGEIVRTAEVNFTPIGTFKLLNLQPGYIIIGNNIYKFSEDGRKKILFQGHQQQLVQEIYFTIQNPQGLVSLEGLQFFFDLKGHSEANSFYHSLQQAQLYINGEPAMFFGGYFNSTQFEIGLKDAMATNGNYTGKMQREIAGVYARQFIHVTEKSISKNNSIAIPALQAAPENVLKQINAPDTIYFNLKFGRPFESTVLERMQVGINAFPVVGRSMEKVHFKTDKWLNIISLPVKGSCIDIDRIETSDGGSYRLSENVGDKDLKEGEAILRSARVSKSSSSEIRNIIEGLLMAIRDESAYFSHVNNDFVATRLVEMSKILTRLEDQIALSKDEKSSFMYLLLKPRKHGENIQVTYWVTDPATATNVKAGQPFKTLNHTLTNNNFTKSLTPAAGAKDTPGPYIQKQMLVRQLSSGGQLISIEDIRLLCYELFEGKLLKVNIEKIMKIQPGKNEGLSRTILIDIKVASGQHSKEDLAFLEKCLRYQLDTKGSFVFPFDIKISEA